MNRLLLGNVTRPHPSLAVSIAQKLHSLVVSGLSQSSHVNVKKVPLPVHSL